MFFGQFYATHYASMGAENRKNLRASVIGLMGDKRQEVSVSATAAFSCVLATLSEKEIGELVDIYGALAAKSIRRKGKMTIAQARSCAVLAAAILTKPYDVPSFVPVAIEALAPHTFSKNAPANVRDIVTKTISEFKRTHSDNWSFWRMKFSAVQLEALDDCTSTSASYYA